MIQNKSRRLERNEILETKKEKQLFESVQRKLLEGVEMTEADAGISMYGKGKNLPAVSNTSRRVKACYWNTFLS